MTGGETVVDGGGGYGQPEDVPVTGGEVMMDEGGGLRPHSARCL
jgi:hypothetical protein